MAELEQDPTAIIELLRECDVKAWLRIAVEYWRLGQLESASAIGEAAVSACVLLLSLPWLGGSASGLTGMWSE